nr:helix-turn-helix transcriptional regulator [Maliibacterium massiliense]
MKIISYNGNKNIVSARVRQARQAMGLSQAALAARLQTQGVNLDQQMVSKIERNARIVMDYELLCLSRVLKRSVAWLLGVEPAQHSAEASPRA